MADATPAEVAPAARPAKANRGPLIAIVSLLVAGGALGFIAYGNLGENLVYYWTPKEMKAQGEKAYGAHHPPGRRGGARLHRVERRAHRADLQGG